MISIIDSLLVSTAKYDNQVHTLRLPPVDNVMALETYLHLMTDDFGCCSNFVSTASTVTCQQCNPEISGQQVNIEKHFKRRGKQRHFQILIV